MPVGKSYPTKADLRFGSGSQLDRNEMNKYNIGHAILQNLMLGIMSQIDIPTSYIDEIDTHLESQLFWFFKQNVLKFVASAFCINMAALIRYITNSNEDIER